MKRTQCKIWRECVGYIPAIVPIESDPTKGNGINIDLTNCIEIDSCGLTIALVQLLKILSRPTEQDWRVESLEKGKSSEIANNLGMLGIISQRHRQDIDMFKSEIQLCNTAGSQTPIEQETYGKTIQSYPIYQLQFTTGPTRRDANILFKKWLLDVLEPLGEKYSFNAFQLIQILFEMGKNSADHTSEDAFFGMDLISQNRFIELRFCFADLGEGIKMHIQNNLPPERASRAAKLSLVEAYYYALKYGYTSNPGSKQNNGFGMTAIRDGCQGLGVELSVFDASSRGLLTCIADNRSHAQLRKAFYKVGIQTGFYYFGTLRLNSKGVS